MRIDGLGRPLLPAITPLASLVEAGTVEERLSRLEERYRVCDCRGGVVPVDRDGLNEGHDLSSRRPQAAVAESQGPLSRSAPAIGLLATFSRNEDVDIGPLTSPGVATTESASRQQQFGLDPLLDLATESILFDIYYDKVHTRYPFLSFDVLRNPSQRPTELWVGYFLNMVFSIGLLVGKDSQLSMGRESHQVYHRLAVTRYLSHVFAQPDRLLHIQAYLLLALHAMYSPSTERIISIASATMRYCVMAQLHLAEAEPPPINVEAKVQSQLRRRVFWSAYALDRTVGTIFDLPFSIPDYQITVKMYANIDERELVQECQAAFPDDPQGQLCHTSVSVALHVVYCRQIQSEILNTTLHREFGKRLDRLSNWRLRVLEKLDRWKSLCHRYSDISSSSHTSSEWLHMIYNYSLAMLYRPTKLNIASGAGDWTVKSCIQAILIFRKFQRETMLSELWLGLIAQFKCGVALLYCFFATPKTYRSEAYETPEASEAVRACSIVLALLAERWPQSKPLRDSFDILAREIPVFSPMELDQGQSPRRMRQESADALVSNLALLETLVVHRDTLRMIREMASDEFPSSLHREITTPRDNEPTLVTEGTEEISSWRTPTTGDLFQPVTPHFFTPDYSHIDSGNYDYAALGFPGGFDPGLPF